MKNDTEINKRFARRGRGALRGISLAMICLLMVIMLFIGCKDDMDTSRIYAGLVVTTAQKYESEILWMDSDFEWVDKQKLKYAMLGTSFYHPVKTDDKIYMIPAGLGNKKDTKKVISINRHSLEIEEYPFSNIALNQVTCLGDNVYTINTLNGDSCLEMYRISDKKNLSIILNGVYIKSLVATTDKVYCVVVDTRKKGSMTSFLNVYTPNLELIKEIDISESGVPSQKYCEDKENIYFTLDTDKDDHRISRILQINKNDLSVEGRDIEEGDMASDIYKYNEGFIVTHYNPVTMNGTKVSVIDKQGAQKMIDLGMTLTLTEIIGDKFVVANNQMLRVYSIPDFKVLQEQKLDIPSSFYVSALLSIK